MADKRKLSDEIESEDLNNKKCRTIESKDLSVNDDNGLSSRHLEKHEPFKIEENCREKECSNVMPDKSDGCKSSCAHADLIAAQGKISANNSFEKAKNLGVQSLSKGLTDQETSTKRSRSSSDSDNTAAAKQATKKVKTSNTTECLTEEVPDVNKLQNINAKSNKSPCCISKKPSQGICSQETAVTEVSDKVSIASPLSVGNSTHDTEKDNFSAQNKKKRTRKRHIVNAIQKLLEFYFSRANVAKDVFMKELLDKDPFVELSLFLNFSKIQSLTNELRLIRHAANNSAVLELSPDETRVRTQLDISPKKNEIECTIYVDQLSRNHTYDWVWNYFSQYGVVEYVHLPLFKDTKKSKGFAFVEFDTPDSAEKALMALRTGNKAGAMDPGHLSSIKPYLRSHDDYELSDYMSSVAPDSSNQGWEQEVYDIDRQEEEEDNAYSMYDECDEVDATHESSETEESDVPHGQPGLMLNLSASESRSSNNFKDVDDSSVDAMKLTPNMSKSSDTNEGEKIANYAMFADNNHSSAAAVQAAAQKKKKKKIHRKIRMKEKEKKRLLELKKKQNCDCEPVELLVMSKSDWKNLKDDYLANQKQVLSACKQIMRLERKQSDKSNTSPNKKAKKSKQKPAKILGTVVKITLASPLEEKVPMMTSIKTNPGVVFVDAVQGERDMYVRFSSPATAQTFLMETVWKERSSLLVWDEEDKYWDKIHASWQEKISGPKCKRKQRGKQKVLARWHKRLEQVEHSASAHNGMPLEWSAKPAYD